MASQTKDVLALLSSNARQAFDDRDFRRCLEQAQQILAALADAKPGERKGASQGLKVGCLAALKLGDVEHAMAFYQHLADEKKVGWDLSYRVVNQLLRLNRRDKLAPVLDRLRAAAGADQKRKDQLASLLEIVDGRKSSGPTQTVSKISFDNRPLIDPPKDAGLSVKVLTRTVFVPSSARFAIAINPKSACSSLKFNVWRKEFEMGASPFPPPKGRGGIHRHHDTAIHKVPADQMEGALFGKPLFSMVRNPYTRILSAYLDKVVGDKKEKRHLLLCMGYTQNVPISFGVFIDFICRQNAHEMDAHYAPQTFLMQIDHVRYARIGSVEEIDRSMSDILAAGYGASSARTADFRPHRTGASAQIAQYYTDEIAAKVLHRFRFDFERFGYSTKLADAELPPQKLEQAASSGKPPETTVLVPLVRAVAAEKRKDYAGALSILSAVTGDDAEIKFIKARVLLKNGRPDEALPLLEAAVAQLPSVGIYWMALAECQAMLGRANDAIANAERAVTIAPTDAVLRRTIKVFKKARARDKAKEYRARLAAVKALVLDRNAAKARPKLTDRLKSFASALVSPRAG